MDSILSIEAIACLVVAGAAAVGVSVVLGYIKDRDGLALRLRKTERQLEKIRSEIAGRQERIKQLTEEVEMLQPIERELSDYYDSLVEIQLEAERREMDEQEKDQAVRDREDRRRRMNL